MSWLCRVGLHKWCRHPQVQSRVVFSDPSGMEKHQIKFYCTECEMEVEKESILMGRGKFHPVEDRRICLRCGENHPA